MVLGSVERGCIFQQGFTGFVMGLSNLVSDFVKVCVWYTGLNLRGFWGFNYEGFSVACLQFSTGGFRVYG